MNILQKSLWLLLPFFLIQCKSDLRQAEDSLSGTWTVIKIISSYGTRTANGTSYKDQITEEGDLGLFVFTEEQVDYRFTRRDTLTAEVSSWALNREKVQEGFTQVERYTLELDKASYRCDFGDGTSDAEKDARDMVLTFETTALGPFTEYSLFLEKD